MRVTPAMTDMKRTDAEKAEDMMVPSVQTMDDYPYGLRICLTEVELEKLGFSSGDLEVGDMIHLFAFATVSSVSESKTDQGTKCRVECTLTHMAAEDEDDENEAADQAESRGPRRLYG